MDTVQRIYKFMKTVEIELYTFQITTLHMIKPTLEQFQFNNSGQL
jgi:hypothetical protein